MTITYKAILYLDDYEYQVADLDGQSKEDFCRERGLELGMAKAYTTREAADAAKISESSHGGFFGKP